MEPNGKPESPIEPAVARAPRLPKDELASLADDYGIDSTRYRTRAELVVALAERRELIAGFDRMTMLEVVRWGRRPVPADADRERLAQEIARIQRWKYAELSREGLIVLARLRGVKLKGDEPEGKLIRLLKRREGWISQVNRKRRAVVAAAAARLVGEDEPEQPYTFLPSENADNLPARQPKLESLRDRIEERGLFGGLADRMRRSADSYVNQKLDEIETRIDRKLEEIDKRLGEWRDKEIANRIRILKITLWASAIVSVVSLAYAYITRSLM